MDMNNPEILQKMGEALQQLAATLSGGGGGGGPAGEGGPAAAEEVMEKVAEAVTKTAQPKWKSLSEEQLMAHARQSANELVTKWLGHAESPWLRLGGAAAFGMVGLGQAQSAYRRLEHGNVAGAAMSAALAGGAVYAAYKSSILDQLIKQNQEQMEKRIAESWFKRFPQFINWPKHLR